MKKRNPNSAANCQFNLRERSAMDGSEPVFSGPGTSFRIEDVATASPQATSNAASIQKKIEIRCSPTSAEIAMGPAIAPIPQDIFKRFRGPASPSGYILDTSRLAVGMAIP